MLTQNALRKPLILAASVLASAGLSACGMADTPQSFEAVAERIAAISLDDETAVRAPASAAQAGLRSADAPLRVAVMEPHAMWDARDDMLEAAVAEAAPRVVSAVADQAEAQVRRAVTPSGLRPAGAPLTVAPLTATSPDEARASRLIQLGAYSSRNAAEAAWSGFSGGEGRWALNGLQPVYEPVEVSGRRLVRLKVRTPAASAAAVCAAARVDDPWCRQG